MKKLRIYFIAITLIFSFSGAIESLALDRVNPHHKRIVRVKPVRPHFSVNRHVRVKHGYVRIEGYWQYNKHHQKYVWVNGHVVKQRHGKRWITGRWRKVRGGWVYVSGFWA